MSDLQSIHGVIGRTRRRLRVQEALEWGTTALIPAIAGALVVLWLWRMEKITGAGARELCAGLVALVGAAAVAGALRAHSIYGVAARLDRASGLADRLGTACEFAEKLPAAAKTEAPETLAMMRAAIADGIAAAPRANPKLAAPFRAPIDWRGAVAFAATAVLVTCLAFHPDPPRFLGGVPVTLVRDAAKRIDDATDKAAQALDPDDLDAARQFVGDLKKLAQETGDPELAKLATDLEKMLQKAENGEISKEDLLAEMERLEKNYMQNADVDIDKTLADLKESGKELEKEPLTKPLGEALEKGDMEQAKKEFEKLADQIDKKELTPEQEQKVADALEKTAEKHDEKQKQDEKKQDEQAEKDLDKKKDEIKKLEKKQKDEPKNEEAKRELEKKKRELEKLERDKDEQKQTAEKRHLERLNRDMKKTAESLKQKNQKKKDQEQAKKDQEKQKGQKAESEQNGSKKQQQKQDEQDAEGNQSSKDMREAGDDSEGVQSEMKKSGNKKRVASQMTDVRDSVRRARQKNGQGNMARAQRMKDFEKRAGGGKGNVQVWKPGQESRQLGKGQGQGQGQQQGQGGQGGDPGDQNGGQGQGDPKESSNYGTGHDDNVMGDPSHAAGQNKDEHLDGVQGKGASRKQTILTSAKKGFASTGYQKVYAEYKKVTEEVMANEKVPQGYKFYVKRYFQRIKPHSME